MTAKVIGKRPIDKSRIKRILIRATNWVGDVVMTLPALEAVKENFPGSSISVLARPWVIPLIENHPAVNEVLPYPKGAGFMARLAQIIRISGLVRGRGYDMAILFQNAFEAALIACLGGIRLRVGYNTDGRRFLLSHVVIRNEEIMKGHQVEYYLSILRGMDWRARSMDPVLFVAERDEEKAGQAFLSHGIGQEDYVVGLSPGAIYGPAKMWPAERFAAIGDLATERWGAKVIILGSQGEKDVCGTVSQSMKRPNINLCGKTTLGEAVGLIKRCHFFVTNDSGLMHVAAALDIPMMAIFGSTDPGATGPRSKKARIVHHQVDCAPCLKPECPHDFRCMLGIQTDEVWDEMRGWREKTRVYCC